MFLLKTSEKHAPGLTWIRLVRFIHSTVESLLKVLNVKQTIQDLRDVMKACKQIYSQSSVIQTRLTARNPSSSPDGNVSPPSCQIFAREKKVSAHC